MEMTMSENPTTPEPAAKPSFVERIKGGAGNFKDNTVEQFSKAGTVKRVGLVAGSLVGLGVAYDGVKRMVTGPTNEAGEQEGQTFGRAAIGAVETATGLALAARMVTGKGPVSAFRG
jgi:hypothetical protein